MTDIFGPKVAIVDDAPAEVENIIGFMEERHVGFKYFNADITLNEYPTKPIDSIELIFLDLYYSPQFNAFSCAQWIDSIIPDKKIYELVVWSKDSHKTDELLGALIEIEKVPKIVLTMQKTDFVGPEGALKLMTEITLLQQKNTATEEFLAEVIEITEDYVVLNCLIDLDSQFYQIRRFEKTPLSHFNNLINGNFLTVKITTEPGERKFEFIEEFEDHSKLFEQKNNFLKFKDGPFFKKDEK